MRMLIVCFSTQSTLTNGMTLSVVYLTKENCTLNVVNTINTMVKCCSFKIRKHNVVHSRCIIMYTIVWSYQIEDVLEFPCPSKDNHY